MLSKNSLFPPKYSRTFPLSAINRGFPLSPVPLLSSYSVIIGKLSSILNYSNFEGGVLGTTSIDFK